MNSFITVFTPTYNRANLLPRGHDALKRQTDKDFIWLIIDDGSTDDTKEVVNQFINDESGFQIKYIYKENGGLHTGYNTAIENIETELCVCIDSDDFLPDNAIELIKACWNERGGEHVVGIIGLDFTLEGHPTCGYFPDVETVFLDELLFKYKYNKDFKVVFKTIVVKEFFPMPTFNSEKNFNPSYVMMKISGIAPFILLNKNLCFVDYQPTGMTMRVFEQYLDSPNSFAELRRVRMTLSYMPFHYVFKECIHYVSSSILSKDRKFIKKSPKKLLTILAIPFGILLYLYIIIKTKKVNGKHMQII